ncbi:MAG: hypothetical protein K8R59_08670, partial [Thermoanaerobaculales bacterium]|nr:hypothetical protein [Thermoanaerobaculales bacterium]
MPDGRPWRTEGWDGSQVWPIYLGSRLVATVRDQPGEKLDLNFVIGDHLGYPEMVINESGAISWSEDHRPFGEIASEYDPTSD